MGTNSHIKLQELTNELKSRKEDNWATDVEDDHIRDELYRKNLMAYHFD